MPVFKFFERLFKPVLLNTASLFARKPEHAEFSPDRNSKLNILIIRPEKIGDVFISFPLVDALKLNFLNISIDIIGSKENRTILDGDPRFNNVFLYTKRPACDLTELKKIRSLKYDCVIDLVCDDSVTSLLLTLLTAGKGYRVGMGKSKYAEYYHRNCHYRTNDNTHIIDNTLGILNVFAIDPEKTTRFSPPFLSDTSKRLANKYFSDIQPECGDGDIIGMNISAGSDSRKWNGDKYKELIAALLEMKENARIVIICAPSDRCFGERMAGQFKERVSLIPPNLSIRDASAIISKLNLLVSPDTSLIHIARSFNVPVVGLYCRFMDNHKLWFPYGQKNGVVLSESETDINDISVERVIDEIMTVLAEKDNVSSRMS